MKQFWPVFLGAILLFSFTGSVKAQFTASSKTNTISAVQSNWVGNISYIVGSNTFKDVLQITNSGGLSNRLGILGYEVSASNNLAIVNNGVWRSQDPSLGNLYVGYNGSGNQLIVTNGGKVFCHIGELGVLASSSNNLAVVTGTGSVWSNEVSVNIGVNGAGNQLIVTNGGTVVDAAGYLGVSAGSNNLVVVTGPGSVWSNTAALYLGDTSVGNRLIVTNGGKVFSLGGAIFGNNASSSNNIAVVTGAGSVWSGGTNTDFEMGYFSGGNQLIVTNGGTVIDGNAIVGTFGESNNSVRIVDNGVWQNSILYVGLSGSSNVVTIDGGSVLVNFEAIIGDTTSSGGDVIRVDSGSLFVTNAAGNGLVVVSLGNAGPCALILNGGSITADSFIATNGANSLFNFNGGTFTVRSANVTDTQGLVVGGTFVFNGGTATVSQLVLTNPAAAMTYNSGLFQTESTSIANGLPFVVGNGALGANLYLLGGVHSFANGLRISNAATLTGCGTVNGSVTVDSGGSVFTDCGTLTFTGTVTNNYAMAVDGTGNVLEFYGTVVNNGGILLYNGGTTNFHGTFINNGVVLDAGWVHVSGVTTAGNDMVIQAPSTNGFRYELQFATSVDSPVWANIGIPQSGTGGVLTFTDPGGATNKPNRFYQVDVIWP